MELKDTTQTKPKQIGHHTPHNQGPHLPYFREKTAGEGNQKRERAQDHQKVGEDPGYGVTTTR